MRPDHPRPQLVRPRFTSLDGPWRFAVDPADEGVRARWFDLDEPFVRTIQVPFPPESPASGIGKDVDGVLWYRRRFEHVHRPGERLLLHFEGVDHDTTVWVNGDRVGDHEGSQTRFTFDVTDAVVVGENVLTVRAVDHAGDLEQPRGKQDWRPDPHVIWYRRTSGIWRTVWLEPVPDVHVEHLVLRPGADLQSVDVEVRVAGHIEHDTWLDLEFRVDGRVLAQSRHRCASALLRVTTVLEHESLEIEPEELWWSPESPTLIDVSVRLEHAGSIDSVSSYLGLRSVATDGAAVLLNGHPYFLRMVLEQAYWPGTHLASPSFAHLEREATLIKDLGFNGVRIHQTSADPRFLACCDRLGLVVWADTAATYRFSHVALTRTVSELAAMVRRDMNHPSIIAWVPFNESWGVAHLDLDARHRHAVRAAYELLKSLDPSRIALGNDGWQYVAGDVVGIHDYSQDPAVLRDRYGTIDSARRTVESGRTGGRAIVLPDGAGSAGSVPVVLSEFGGISVHDDDGTAWRAYGEVVDADDLAARIGALVAGIDEPSGLAGYCYTQLTDTAQEKNGLLTEEREPKIPVDHIREALRGRPGARP